MKVKHIVTTVIAGILVTSMAQADIEGYDGNQEQQRERRQDGKRKRKQDGKQERNKGRKQNRRGRRPPMGMMLGRIASNPEVAKKLGISDEQITAIKEAIGKCREQQESLREKMKAAGEEQLKLLKADEVNEEALLNAVEKTGGIRTEIAKLHIKQMLVMKKILSPEQVAKIHEFMKNRGHKDRGKDKGDRGNQRKNRNNDGEGGGGRNREGRG